MVSGPNTKGSMEALMKDTLFRVTAVERRLAVSGGGGGGGGGAGITLYPGDIEEIPDAMLPAGMLWCDGSAVSRTTYADLFAKIGTRYGGGDGSTTFNLPNLNGKSVSIPSSAPLAAMALNNCFANYGGNIAAEGAPGSYEIYGVITGNAAAAPYLRFTVGGVETVSANYEITRSGNQGGAAVNDMPAATTQHHLSTANTNVRTMFSGTIDRAGHADYTEIRTVQHSRGSSRSVLMASTTVTLGTVFDGISIRSGATNVYGWVAVVPIGGSLVPSAIRFQEEVIGSGGQVAGLAGQPGVIQQYAGSSLPSGALWCDGAAVSRSTYSALFAVIGTTYGAGDGSTTFNVPNFKGRSAFGLDAAQTEFDVLGETGGAKTHTHTEGDLKAAIGAVGGNAGSLGYPASTLNPRGPTTTTAYSLTGMTSSSASVAYNHHTPVFGTTAAGSSLPPYLVTNFIIWTGQGTGAIPQVPVSGWGKGTTAERDATYGVPSTDAQKATLANSKPIWFNTEKGWEESYFAVTGTAGLTARALLTGFPSGWYPITPGVIWGTTKQTADQTVVAGDVQINVVVDRLSGGMTFANGLAVPLGGFYDVNASVYSWDKLGTYRGAQAYNSTEAAVLATGTGVGPWAYNSPARRVPIKAGSVIVTRSSGDAQQTMRAMTEPSLTVSYVSPPLVNN